MEPNLVSLLKSDSIRIDDEHTMIVMYYYHQEHVVGPRGNRKGLKDKTFYRCACRVDSNENWRKLAEGLTNENPAELFSLPEIGLPDDMHLRSDYTWTRTNARRWLLLRISKKKIHTLDEFIHGRKTTTGLKPGRILKGAFDSNMPYLRAYSFNGVEYSIETPYDFPKGVWLVSTRVAPPRKKPKVITD